MSASVQIQNLSLQYDGSDSKALNNLSFDIEQGAIFGLLGPNGAGKTSLISILSGLLKPSEGNAFIEGLSINKDREKLKQLIGVVPQEYALYPQLTARENLQFFGSMYGLRKAALKQGISEGLEKVKLTHFADKKISTYSGGMKRRINLLIGLLHRPKVLFLDEPTVGVDVQSKIAILDYLSALNQNGITIVYCSHILHEVQSFCSHVALLNHGEIKIIGKTSEVLKNEEDNLETIFLKNTATL